jgi:hypothetical protein
VGRERTISGGDFLEAHGTAQMIEKPDAVAEQVGREMDEDLVAEGPATNPSSDMVMSITTLVIAHPFDKCDRGRRTATVRAAPITRRTESGEIDTGRA